MNTSSVTTANHASQPFHMSRNELKSLCMKAARGMGMSWGLAQEAGFAVSWLSRHGMDGATPLQSVLASELLAPPEFMPPATANDVWQAHSANERINPIVLGATLLDYANVADGPLQTGIHLIDVAYPILLLPFVVAASRQIKGSLCVDQGNTMITLSQGAVQASVLTAFATLQRADIRLLPVAVAGVNHWVNDIDLQRATIHHQTIAALQACALRTMVPASDASRMRGAGSLRDDND